jgi:hypothetical protein
MPQGSLEVRLISASVIGPVVGLSALFILACATSALGQEERAPQPRRTATQPQTTPQNTRPPAAERETWFASWRLNVQAEGGCDLEFFHGGREGLRFWEEAEEERLESRPSHVRTLHPVGMTIRFVQSRPDHIRFYSGIDYGADIVTTHRIDELEFKLAQVKDPPNNSYHTRVRNQNEGHVTRFIVERLQIYERSSVTFTLPFLVERKPIRLQGFSEALRLVRQRCR